MDKNNKYVKIGACPVLPEDTGNRVEWQAYWIQDPLFAGRVYRQVRTWTRKEKDRSEITNIHTLFRKSFFIDGSKRVKKAILYITADDMYKLYINGSFAGTGPAPSYLYAYSYNAWDVTEYLVSGRPNCIGVHVYYQGLYNLAHMSADNLEGLLAQLEIEYGDGTAERVVSDTSWKYRRSGAWTGSRTYGYETQFAEDVDLRKWDGGWMQADFDDSTWGSAYLAANPAPPWYNIVPQQTPPVDIVRVFPERIVRKGEGRFFIDFGSEITGTTAFRVSGGAGRIVEVRHGEELLGPDEVRYDLRANCCYREYITLSGKKAEEFEFYDYKGFRYVEVINWPGELTGSDIWVMNRHYPFDDGAASFKASEKLLEDIWKLCANGVKQGTQDSYLDCPTREKGAFLGDGIITGLSHLILTGDARIMKKFLRDAAYSSRLCPGLLGVAPAYRTCELIDYSMLWPLLLGEYCARTGDMDFLREMLPVLKGIFYYYSQFENRLGLLENVRGMDGMEGILVDWPINMRDGYDFERAVNSVCTVANMFYYGGLKTAAGLYEAAGETEEKQACTLKAEKVAEACRRNLMDSESGLFVDALGSSHVSQHANVLPLVFGMKPPKGYDPLIKLQKEKRVSCGAYFAFFLLKGLYNVGEYGFAYELMTSHEERSWFNMLKEGATTCMEAWGADQKTNCSWCHPWSSTPVSMVSSHLFGITPGEAGWEAVNFSPCPAEKLEWAELEFKLPQGSVRVRMESHKGVLTYDLHIPENCRMRCDFPAGYASVEIDGIRYEIKKRKNSFGVDRMHVDAVFSAGRHFFILKKLSI